MRMTLIPSVGTVSPAFLFEITLHRMGRFAKLAIGRAFRSQRTWPTA